MAFTPDDRFLSLNQDTNRFLGVDGDWINFYSIINNFTSWVNWNPLLYVNSLQKFYSSWYM